MSRSNSRSKGPLVKAQLPKINFELAKQQQVVLDQLLNQEYHFKDSREIAERLINRNDYSFEHDHSHQQLRDNLHSAQGMFSTKIVQKQSSRQKSRSKGTSMVLPLNQSFAWMDEFQKKNAKSNIPKPARNPIKIQETFTKVDVFRSTINIINDVKEDNFEMQGLNTNKNLKIYDCYDEIMTPQQIVEYFKSDPGYHGKSPLYLNNHYEWSDVQVISYDEIVEKYQVKVLKTGQIKYVNRLSLWLKFEQESEFKNRQDKCKQLQKQAEEELRFFKYVNSIQENIPKVSQEQKQRILSKLKVMGSKDLMQDLFEQVEYEHQLFIKKFIVLQKMQQNYKEFFDLRIRKRTIKEILQPMAPLRMIKQDYNQNKSKLSNVYFLSQRQVMRALLRITSKIHNFENFKLIPHSYSLGQLPFVLSNLEVFNNESHNNYKQNMKTVWKQFVIQDIQDALRNQYNFYQTDEQAYFNSDLHQMMVKIDNLFTKVTIEQVLIANVQNWVNFIKSFTIPTNKDQLWSIHKDPLLVLNLVVIQQNKKKTMMMKRSSVHRIEEEKVIFFEPDKSAVCQILLNPLNNIKETLSQFYGLEKDLLPLLNINKQSVIPEEYTQKIINQAKTEILKYIEYGFEDPNKVLEQFSKFGYFFTKSQSHLMKRLFGDSKERPLISALDIEKIEERINYYINAIHEVQSTCIDERQFVFFQIRTKQIKQQLVQQGTQIINGILLKLSDVVIENIARISKNYQDMQEKILQQPKDEKEMVNLKNFIAEAEVNLAKIQNEVSMIDYCLHIFLNVSYQFDLKEIENFFDLKSWPNEIRIALVQGSRNVTQQELKFTEKLENEKELFARELIEIELQLQDIKQYHDFTQVKECASMVMQLKDKLSIANDKLRSFNDRENLFKQPLSEYDDLKKIKTEFEPYYKMWDTGIEFEIEQQEWQTGSFLKLNYPQIEKKTQQYYIRETNKLVKYFSDIEDERALKILKDMKAHIDKFVGLLWVIELLTTEAIQKKPQTWKELFIQCDIEMEINEDVSLQTLIDHNILKHRQIIEDISKRASNQWDIEKKLTLLVEKVREIKLEFMPYSGTYILKQTDDIQQLLDDQLNTLLLLKASPHIKHILNRANFIEQKLILLQDTIENWVKTQRGWMYLDPIFASDDIKKKLPMEKQKFDNVDKYWRLTMDLFFKEPLLWEGIDNEKFKHDSHICNMQLEEIQQGLSQYLESKRKFFPRFFFLSDDGLLEILAQTKDPITVQKHINKCFEAINSLTFNENEVTEMISPENEKVQFYKPINVVDGDKKGNVERWLVEIEQVMIETLKRLMSQCNQDQTQRLQWIDKWPAQCILAVNMVRWTQQTEDTIIAQTSQNSVSEYVHPSLSYFAEYLQDQILKTVDHLHNSPRQRHLLSQLIVLDVHNRDVIQSLDQAISIKSFQWLANMRYYADDKKLKVSMINSNINYGFEYLGNTTRLVITPLTDRCYRTLMGAFTANYGGAPEGPAGTGKTETVKDLSKAVGMQCIVFNCSDGLNYLSMSKFFKGLASCGAWCCFDEFNRIDLEVLSVIASQITTIQAAIRDKKKIFFFETDEYILIPTCCINITMNPTYTGRSILPDNLKALFRPCAMMVPDYRLIAAIYLFSVGFQEAEPLAVKIVASLKLSSEQLSSQDHYDFGMRALKAILTAAGNLKRQFQEQQQPEELLCLRSLLDVNQPKFLQRDIPLFMSIISDLFPKTQQPDLQNHQLLDRIKKQPLQLNKQFLDKCQQLFDTMNVRHGVMNVGEAYSGKSKTLEALSKFMNSTLHKINPKSITNEQLYGKLDPDTKVWSDGVVAKIMRESQGISWIVFDGPVDAIWIENMNTVLDDNKKLCLTSGEIIKLGEQTTMIFEVADLLNASPATVSRCGMVYFESLSWEILIDEFVEKHKLEGFKKRAIWLLDVGLATIKSFPIYKSEIAIVNQFLNLFQSYLPFQNEEQLLNHMLFSVIWSLGAVCDEKQRIELNQMWLKQIKASSDIVIGKKLKFPFEPNVINVKFLEQGQQNFFDLQYDPSRGWLSWMNTQFSIHQDANYHEIIIPMNDSMRNNYLLQRCNQNKIHILLTGPTGTGKSLNIQQFLKDQSNLQITFSGQTSANQLQRIIESKITQRRRKGHFGPEDGKKCTIFIDDMNMPIPILGAQAPIELLRQWMDNGGWYDLETKEFKYFEDIVFVGAMLPRHSVSSRFLRHFFLLYAQPLNQESLTKIFGCMVEWMGIKQPRQISNVLHSLVQSTIQLYVQIQSQLLPTPTKSHYTYNLRDISKVFQGLSKGKVFLNDYDVIKLWVHECQRVFADRLIDQQDQDLFQQFIGGITKQIKKDFIIQKDLMFCQFINTVINEKKYVDTYLEIDSREKIKQKIKEYGFQDVVLFNVAIDHILRIVRVLKNPYGHMLLVGVSGSGRRTLANLSSQIAIDNELYQANEKSWIEDMQKLMKQAGLDNKTTAFLHNTTNHIEQICNVLNNGEIPNLFPLEEKIKILEEISQPGTPQEKFQYFIQQCKNELHVIICLSPQELRQQLRAFPALVNCTTIDWFQEWPQEALIETGQYFIPSNLVPFAVQMHQDISQLCIRYIKQMRQYYYVTPTSYINQLKMFNRLLEEKQSVNLIQRYTQGVEKILSTEAVVTQMKKTLEDLQPKLQRSTLENSGMLINLQKKQKEADFQKQQCMKEEQDCNIQREMANLLKDDCQMELEKVMPILASACEALEKITAEDMNFLKSFQKPPAAASKVMEGLCYVFDEDKQVKFRPKEPGSFEKIQDFWEYSKKNLLNDKLIKRVKNFKDDQIKAIHKDKIAKLRLFVNDPDFNKDKVFNASKAAGNLSLWIRAVVDAYEAFLIVDPKKAQLEIAEKKLKEAEFDLENKKAALLQVQQVLQELEKEYQAAKSEKDQLESEVTRCKKQLDLAEKLIQGLSGEKENWKQKANFYRQQVNYYVGDCLLSSGIISYFGPFPLIYRQQLLESWIQQINIPISNNYSLQNIQCDPITIGIWTNQQKLPNDQFSIDNAIILKSTQMCCLIIDPQVQANNWIKINQQPTILKLSTPQQELIIENALALGQCILLEDVGETIDQIYLPLLKRQMYRGQIKLYDKYVDVNQNFRFFMTTKMQRPHYTADICVNVTLLNFMITQEGLEDQLLNILVKIEEPIKEEARIRNIKEFFENKNKKKITEDLILTLLNESSGNLLDDETLTDTLQKSKIEQLEIDEKLKKSEHDQNVFNQIRSHFRPAAKRVSQIYQVLQDLALIESTYQWSLDFYITLYEKAIKESSKDQRIQKIVDSFEKLLYTAVCRSLLEKDKQLFSFMFLLRSLMVNNEITIEEIRFLLIGSGNDQESPYQFINNRQWGQLVELSKFACFNNLLIDLQQNSAKFQQDDLFQLEYKDFRTLQIIKILSPHKFSQSVQRVIKNNLGKHFIDPPPFDLDLAYQQSQANIPIIFILSTGADPRIEIQSLADRVKIPLVQLSLGQGQGQMAEKAIRTCLHDGKWVLLQNCHLAKSFMKDLERIYESIEQHQGQFRLWLTTAPSDSFPITLLQKGMKLTFEPPRGLKNNLLRVFNSIDPKKFDDQSYEYKKLLFGLVFFHAIIIERRKFGPIGWNVPYEFTQADFSISHQQLKTFIEDYQEIPFDAINYMIETNYGGRVTDQMDRKLLANISSDYMSSNILLETHTFTQDGIYYAPEEGNLLSYIEYIQQLPNDQPEIFGLHPNADVSSSITEADKFCQAILQVLPTTISIDNNQQIKVQAQQIISQLPAQFDLELVQIKFPIIYSNSFNTVLQQELQRFNRLHKLITISLQELILAIDGLAVMNDEVEKFYNSIYDNIIPYRWLQISYPSQKNLSDYIQDFIARLKFFQNWIDNDTPKEFWISGFYFTQSFLTGVTQNYSRKYQIPIDSLQFEHTIMDFEIQQQVPMDGCYIYGMIFEGGCWDQKLKCIVEQKPGVLTSPVPRIWLLPSQNIEQKDNVYQCPVYRTPNRQHYLMQINVPAYGNQWIKSGLAMIT